MNKQEISSAQLLFMSVGSAMVFPYTFMPILSSPPKNQDVWISLIMAFAYIIVINFPVIFITNKFKGMLPYKIADTIVGKIAGKIYSILITIFFIFCFTACSIIMLNFIKLYVLPDTPNWAVLLFLVIPAGYAAYKGAGTIGRLSIFIVPAIILSILIFFILGLNVMDINNIRPILQDSTFIELNQGAFFTAARYSEILIFFIFSCYLKKKASVIKTYGGALVLFGISFMLILLPILLVLGAQFAQNEWNPYFVYSRQLQNYDFIRRVQSLNILVWFPCSILKLSIYLYMAGFMLKGITGVKSYKYFILPEALILFITCSLDALNRTSLLLLLTSDVFFPYVIFFLVFVLPVLMLIVYFIRRKKIDKQIDEEKKAQESG